MGDVDLGEGWTTRIGSSRALTQVRAGAGADLHRRRNELDRDLGGIMAVILGVEASRTADFINQSEGAAEAKAAVAAAVAAAAIFHLLIRRLLSELQRYITLPPRISRQLPSRRLRVCTY